MVQNEVQGKKAWGLEQIHKIVALHWGQIRISKWFIFMTKPP